MSSSFCEYCYCIRGKKMCIRPRCHLSILGCLPRYSSEWACCPTSYACGEWITFSSYKDLSLSLSWKRHTRVPLTHPSCSSQATVFYEIYISKYLTLWLLTKGLLFTDCDSWLWLSSTVTFLPFHCVYLLFILRDAGSAALYTTPSWTSTSPSSTWFSTILGSTSTLPTTTVTSTSSPSPVSSMASSTFRSKFH